MSHSTSALLCSYLASWTMIKKKKFMDYKYQANLFVSSAVSDSVPVTAFTAYEFAKKILWEDMFFLKEKKKHLVFYLLVTENFKNSTLNMSSATQHLRSRILIIVPYNYCCCRRQNDPTRSLCLSSIPIAEEGCHHLLAKSQENRASTLRKTVCWIMEW